MKKVYNLQKTYDFTTDNFEKIVNITKYCSDNLQHDEWELIAIKLIPAIYKFKFKCDKQKIWAVLGS